MIVTDAMVDKAIEAGRAEFVMWRLHGGIASSRIIRDPLAAAPPSQNMTEIMEAEITYFDTTKTGEDASEFFDFVRTRAAMCKALETIDALG